MGRTLTEGVADKAKARPSQRVYRTGRLWGVARAEPRQCDFYILLGEVKCHAVYLAWHPQSKRCNPPSCKLAFKGNQRAWSCICHQARRSASFPLYLRGHVIPTRCAAGPNNEASQKLDSDTLEVATFEYALYLMGYFQEEKASQLEGLHMGQTVISGQVLTVVGANRAAFIVSARRRLWACYSLPIWVITCAASGGTRMKRNSIEQPVLG